MNIWILRWNLFGASETVQQMQTISICKISLYLGIETIKVITSCQCSYQHVDDHGPSRVRILALGGPTWYQKQIQQRKVNSSGIWDCQSNVHSELMWHALVMGSLNWLVHASPNFLGLDDLVESIEHNYIRILSVSSLQATRLHFIQLDPHLFNLFIGLCATSFLEKQLYVPTRFNICRLKWMHAHNIKYLWEYFWLNRQCKQFLGILSIILLFECLSRIR